MARDWENTLRTWGKSPSQSEIDRCNNAERAVREAIDSWPAFASRNVRVFAQGSYANRTNVVAESDVDIAVLCTDTCFPTFAFAEGFTAADVALPPATYHYSTFRNDVQNALEVHFGKASVIRGNKAFDIHANTYRVDADVVACFEHRRYLTRDIFKGYQWESGTEFFPDRGVHVVNWPQQNYDNGVAKNLATGQRFKAMVRGLKNLRNEMADEGILTAKPIASFLIECLVWNVPPDRFNHDTYTEDMRQVLLLIYNATLNDQACTDWVEENDRKYLFRPAQAWTREQVNAFVASAWDYLGFA